MNLKDSEDLSISQFSPTANSLSKIRSKLPELTNSELKVANWVLQNVEKVVHLAMAQVAQECGVSDTTVLRFCRDTGFQGYMHLKIAIAQDIAKPTQIIHDTITENDDVSTIASKIFMSNIQALHDTLEVIDKEALTKAVDLLERAKRILIIGVGTSSPIVQDMFNKLFRLGLNVRCQTDSYLQLMDVALVEPGDVVVGISQSGGSTDPVLTLEEAKKNGANTICITGNAQSPLTRFADITLLSVSNETRAEAIASRIAQATIVDVLYVALAMRKMEIAIKNERKIWNAVMPKTL